MKRQGKNENGEGGKRRRPPARQPRPELGCHELLALLKSGEIKGKCIHRSDRLRLVEYLHGEAAMKQVGMAKLLQCDEKTIRTDMGEIRRANALRADPAFADEIAGEILAMARSLAGQANQVGCDKSTPPAIRVKAARSGMRLYIEGMKMLQSLGHLPSAALRIKMEPNNTAEKPASLGDLVPELERLAQIAEKESPSTVPLLNSLRDAVRTGVPGQRSRANSMTDTDADSPPPTAPPVSPTAPMDQNP